MNTKYNYNAIKALLERNYSKKHVALIIGCSEDVVYAVTKKLSKIEPSIKFLTREQKQRWYVLDKLLELKPITSKWCHKEYVYITILKFLQIPRDIIYNLYKYAPLPQVANAYKEKTPRLKEFSYADININSEEWQNFMLSCYKLLHFPYKWR